MSDRVLRFPDRTWDELEGLPQPLRNATEGPDGQVVIVVQYVRADT